MVVNTLGKFPVTIGVLLELKHVFWTVLGCYFPCFFNAIVAKSGIHEMLIVGNYILDLLQNYI